MKRETMRKMVTGALCASMLLTGSMSAFAAGYEVISETNIPYSYVEGYYDDGYDDVGSCWNTRTYSNLISNFSNGYSVVYENCVEQTNGFVLYTTFDSSYVIDQNGNRVEIGDFDVISSETPTLGGRTTTFECTRGSGIDMYGGVVVCKDGKCGYLGLKDGIKIPCEHTGAILRYDDNVFGVSPDYYLGKAEYYIDVTGKRLLTDIDLSPVAYEKYTFTPSLKYLGNNVFVYFYEPGEDNQPPKARYIDLDGNEVQGYTPKVDISQLYYSWFDEDALRNYYHYEFDDFNCSLEGNCGIFPNANANRKYGMLDKNKNIIVPYIFDDISGFQDGYCWVAQNGKWSLLQISTDDISVSVNNQLLSFDQIPLIINGRTLAPLRAIFEALGATVDWNDETQTITSSKGDITVSMTIGKNEMYKNGEMIGLDEAPQIVGERTLVPVRAIAEAFDCNVDWDDDTNTVLIKN